MMRCNYVVTVKAEGGGTDSVCPAALLFQRSKFQITIRFQSCHY